MDERKNSSDDTSKRNFFKSTYGLLLFGAPNRGLRHHQLQDWVGENRTRVIIDDLLVDKDGEITPLLRELNREFSDCCELGAFEIFSFWETKPTPTAKASRLLSESNHLFLTADRNKRTVVGSRTGPP